MKKRRESENNMMEVAIEKASQLISLLQKENADLKKKVDTLER
jgi:FtsZ-binding cell division protein ZapB